MKEGVEIAGPAGTNLDGWLLYPIIIILSLISCIYLTLKSTIYDSHGSSRGELKLRGLLPAQQAGFGTLYVPVVLPNLAGGHALALVNGQGAVVHFISWGGMHSTNKKLEM